MGGALDEETRSMTTPVVLVHRTARVPGAERCIGTAIVAEGFLN
jgi:hypothetical protein